jgi:hypothetical protein
MSLRIPLSPDQTLQTEFHEIERRLRKLEKATGVTAGSTRVLIAGSSGTGVVNLQPIYDRLNDLEDAINGIPTPVTNDFGGVGPSSVHGLVPAPGVALPPTGVAGRVLLEDGRWGEPFRGLIGVATPGDETEAVDVVDINAGLHVGHILAADVDCYNLNTHGEVDYCNTFWEDLRFPAQGINPAGSPAPAGVDTATGLLSFSGTIDNVIGGVAQMPHSWKRGTSVRPHIHLRFTTSAAANTRWQFRYDVATINGNFVNASGTYTSLTAVTVANPQNTAKHVIADLGDVPMTGVTESGILLWQVWRLANSDAADNDTNAALLMEFDIHFQVGKPGTPDEIPAP